MQLLDTIRSSVDNVYKLVYDGAGNIPLEVSYIRKNDGKDILCVPTQTSCKMGCKFCHLTGLDIPADNLSADTIVDLVNSALEFQRPDNPTLLISFMGAGEPLLNVSGLIESARRITIENDLKSLLGYRNVRFAVSTIIPTPRMFDDFTWQVVSHQLPFKLHWSLHSTNVETRKSLMPCALSINEAAPLLSNYAMITGQPVEIHYTLIDGINDTSQDVENIAKIVDKNFTIKLLKFAPRQDNDMAESVNTLFFRSELEKRGFTVEVYSPPGRDIGSSCGQFIVDQYIK